MNRRNFLHGLVLACPIAAKLPVADRQTIAVRLISRWGAVYTVDTTIISFDLTTYCFSTDELPSYFNEITHVQLVAFGKLQPPIWIRDTAHLYLATNLSFAEHYIQMALSQDVPATAVSTA
jgi:hypothetical protein